LPYQSILSFERYLYNKKVGEIPCRHESEFQMSPHFFLIKLNSPVKCVAYTLQNFVVNVLPYGNINNMRLQFAAPKLKTTLSIVTAPLKPGSVVQTRLRNEKL
jgi:hypothetical protein